MNYTKPIAFIDIESTGLDIAKDRIIEICIIKKFPDGSSQTYKQLVNPDGREINEEAFEKHKLSIDELIDKPVFADICIDVFEFIKDCDIGGYNIIRYDLPLLVEEFLRCKIVYNYQKVKIIDPLAIYTKYEPRTLEGAYKKYMGKELKNSHRAENDIKATIEIFEKQIELYDLPSSVDGISDEIIEEKLFDLNNKIIKKNNEPIINFGKYKGEKFKDVFENDFKYLKWVINSELPMNTKMIFNSLIKKLSR